MNVDVAGDDRVDPSLLVRLVVDYAREVCPAVLEQVAGGWVCSPLGVWVLLAACAAAASGDDLRELERSLGCSAPEARGLLEGVLQSPPSALKAAIALWVSAADATEQVADLARRLPSEVQAGLMPSQSEADEWAARCTGGLIGSFPLELVDARIVLASALALKVSWTAPFGALLAGECLGPHSPWRGAVKRLLWDERPVGAALARTHAAGVVAVHQALAVEDVRVVSVSADPSVPPARVLRAAHEIAADLGDTPGRLRGCSLFDVPAGGGHSWQITERETATRIAGERVERITGASLPAWRIETQLDLKEATPFGTAAALNALLELIGPQPGDLTAAAPSRRR